MHLLYGKPVAEKILTHLKDEIFLQCEKPGLAVVLVGNNQASKIYVSLKEKTAKEVGINFFRFDLDEKTPEQEILTLIEKLNNDNKVNGIIVQLPLPAELDTQKIISSIDPKKDADGFSGELIPVFPHAILRLMESSEQILDGKKAVVIANSELFGSAMVTMLCEKNILAEYLLAGDISSNLGKIKSADIVVSAVGSPGLLRPEMFADGAIIIDGGIEKVGERVVGDVLIASDKAFKGYIAPVPGGVGPVTIACLLENVYLAFKAQQKEKNSWFQA